MTQRSYLDLFPTAPSQHGGRILVPEGEQALVLKDGLPERFLEPGLHLLLLDPGAVEIRLLPGTPGEAGPPGPDAVTLPYLQSFLTRDGALMGVLKGRLEAPVQAWENGTTPAGLAEHYREGLRACPAEPLRACLPASGACCGGRLGSAA